MPDYGTVRRSASRPNPYIDFWPDIKNKRHRFLWSFMGKPFADEAEAELVRNRINARALEVDLEEAINQFRSIRSKGDLVSNVVDGFIDAAPTNGSLRGSGEPYSPRTIDHYKAVLNRSLPYFEGMSMRQFFKKSELVKFKAWFRLRKRPDGEPANPKKWGRGLTTDNEMANCFVALRAVVSFYQMNHPRFSVNWPPNPTKQTIAKKARKEKSGRGRKGENALTLRQVVQAISAIPSDRQPIFWALFFTQCRICEARGVRGRDYLFEDGGEGEEKGRLFIENSAADKTAKAAIRNTTKTGVDGSYLLPEFVQELIARHCSHAQLDPDLPLFQNPHRLAGGDLYSDDAIRDTWKTALSRLGLP